MEQLKKYDLVIHDAEIVDGEGKTKGHTYYSGMHSSTSFLMNLWKTRWLGCCMGFNREVLDYCLPFPNKIEGHDYWIGMMGMLKFKYLFMPDVLMCYNFREFVDEDEFKEIKRRWGEVLSEFEVF